ncbi:hypothetical protein BABINDRAFT_73916 [Babjeviella inositovora NRRL Y-12698]|uniref:Protein DML1 n=1 Tax=Babjeviella inositovora NRRL Y-12698 TaxID=984486 RepID=A0A1E3QYA7_9ASCO|nr:uncharacterized protein BABINDRAFT_73916 [Babjeviella inositovora NRRL Y-12698]ODQ82601.1 hypothetical protein BABINDRAFT_73916 [Babjeviella inositovora NRRL Y-12698]
MPEILNVSMSQRANHLTTHFYNAQDSYLDYVNGAAKSKVDPNVFFNPTPSWDNRSITFNPRAMLFDLSGGFGSLGQYEYYLAMEAAQHHDDASPQDRLSQTVEIVRQERIPKSEYLQALDTFQPTPELTTENTTYWSDYARIIYEPKSFNCVDNWEYHPKEYPGGRLRAGASKTFLDYLVGVDEWKGRERVVHFMDDTFRVFLEKSDQLDGLNLMSEVDTAWGGMAGEFITDMRDEFIPKTSVFTWGLHSPQPTGLTPQGTLSRVRASLALINSSSLYIPLSDPTSLPEGLSVTPTSLWNTTALQMLPVDAVGVLLAQRANRVSMTELELGVTMGSKRNIVAETKGKVAGEMNYTLDFTGVSFKPSKSKNHVFSKTVVVRNATSLTSEEFDAEYETQLQDFGHYTELLEKGTELRGLVHHKSLIPFATPDSFPKGILGEQTPVTCASMAVATSTRASLLEMKTFVSRFLRGDDRESLIDELETLALEYEHGWMDDDLSDDDDY